MGGPVTAADLAKALGGARRSGDSWQARCPAHDDRNPSLSITQKDGKLLLHCFAGCRQEDVIEALRARRLWAEPERRESVRPKQSKPQAAKQDELGPVIAQYVYTDTSGNPLYRITRHEPKNFRKWRPDGKGGWLLGARGATETLYRLREVAEAPIVFVVEGEKDVETLRQHGFVATCNPHGAGKWKPQYADLLTGRTCIVIPDCDAVGRKHANDVVRSLRGKASRIILLDIQEDGVKDISEWFERGHSEVELCNILEHAWAEEAKEVR